MTDHLQKLEASALGAEFTAARKRYDTDAMVTIMKRAGLLQVEIDAVMWSVYDDAAAGARQSRSRWKRISDGIIGRIGVGVICGLILGSIVLWIYWGFSLPDPEDSARANEMLNDPRTTWQIYSRPFFWGFGIGFIGGLLTGTLYWDPMKRFKNE